MSSRLWLYARQAFVLALAGFWLCAFLILLVAPFELLAVMAASGMLIGGTFSKYEEALEMTASRAAVSLGGRAILFAKAAAHSLALTFLAIVCLVVAAFVAGPIDPNCMGRYC